MCDHEKESISLADFRGRRLFSNELMMTDTQELLANFVRNGSEAAFRELVTRYLDLVYSTAVRLVDGDTHRAQDVSQTVFAAKEGGYTCFVEEVPAAISQGETLGEAKENLLEALKLVLECQRELAEKELSPNALRETIELAEA